MVSGSLALLYFLLGFHGGRQGSGPDRGRSPLECRMGRFSVHSFVHSSILPLGHLANAHLHNTATILTFWGKIIRFSKPAVCQLILPGFHRRFLRSEFRKTGKGIVQQRFPHLWQEIETVLRPPEVLFSLDLVGCCGVIWTWGNLDH